MTAKGNDGVSLRAHLENDAGGILPNPVSAAKLASEPPLPGLAASVWAKFLELHLRRAYTENGPMRLPWTEIEAYRRAPGRSLRGWELTAIFAVEDAFFEVRAENEANKPTPNKPAAKPLVERK